MFRLWETRKNECLFKTFTLKNIVNAIPCLSTYYSQADRWVRYYWAVISALSVAVYFILPKNSEPIFNNVTIVSLSYLVVFVMIMGIATITVFANSQRSAIAISIQINDLKRKILQSKEEKVNGDTVQNIDIAKFHRIFYAPSSLIILSTSVLSSTVMFFILFLYEKSIITSSLISLGLCILTFLMLERHYRKIAFQSFSET